MKYSFGVEKWSTLVAMLEAASRITVLTGAGCSTESGIPDYRGPDGEWRSSKPVQYAEFVRDPLRRRHYWARSYRGWDRFAGARPNTAHFAIAALERAGRVSRLITQNVDGLHGDAGSRAMIELHGNNHRVDCLDCRATIPRAELQQRLAALNPEWDHEPSRMLADGDAEIEMNRTASFEIADCGRCGGILKPDVVFFGENVPLERVALAMKSVETSDALLVVGSSLAVWSGYRFARAAAGRGIPIAILNRGWTRADELAAVKLDAACGEVLPALVAEIAGGRDPI